MRTLAISGDLAPRLSWDLIHDVRQLLEFPFMVNAYRAGTIVAIVAGVLGWFVVLRRQSFAAHTVALVGFPGATGAALVGVSAVYGYFSFAVAASLLIALVPRSGSAGFSDESAVTGTVQAVALAGGFLFLSLRGTVSAGVAGPLFGSFLGITTRQVATLAVFGAAALVVVAVIGRPLLFASLDPGVAAARGVPVRALSIMFVVLLAIAAAEVAQLTGSLLVFALLVAPAAAAQALTTRPGAGLVMTVAIAVVVTWGALFLAYFSPYPIGFFLTLLSFTAYLLARAWNRATASRTAAT